MNAGRTAWAAATGGLGAGSIGRRDRAVHFLYAENMEVHFTPEQKAQITQAARASGTDAAQLVKNAALQVADDANFRAAVMEAKEYADRGEFIEEDEMDARFEEMLRS